MPPAKTPSKPGKRRTQAERSDAMRSRLLDATLAELLEKGHAATSITSIVKRAGVSRGAHLHHYPSKEALFNDAAEHLMRAAYRQLGCVLLDSASAKDRLEALVKHTWSDLFGGPFNHIYTELLVASRRDKTLELVLRELSKAAIQPIAEASRHFFESTDPAIRDVNIPFLLNQWLLRGMALDLGLVGEDSALLELCLRVWRHMLASHIKPREDVQGGPARPKVWDLHWPDLLRESAANPTADSVPPAQAKRAASRRSRSVPSELKKSERKKSPPSAERPVAPKAADSRTDRQRHRRRES